MTTTSAPAPPKIAWDPFRLPRVRMAMNMLLQKSNGRFDRLEVREGKDRVVLTMDIDNDGIGEKSVEMSLPEASRLADLLNRIRHKVADRKEWQS